MRSRFRLWTKRARLFHTLTLKNSGVENRKSLIDKTSGTVGGVAWMKVLPFLDTLLFSR